MLPHQPVRALDRVYPVILIDAIVMKVRSAQVGNRPVCGSPR